MASNHPSKGEHDLRSTEEEKERENKEIIIFQDPTENLVSASDGATRTDRKDDLVKDLDQREDLLSTRKTGHKASRSLKFDKKGEASLSPKPRKKQIRASSLASPMETRSSCKSDVGSMTKIGRKLERESGEEETIRCLANRRQSTLKDFPKNKK